MASLTIRNIDEALKENLRMCAAENSRSMEEEARQILKNHLLRKKSKFGIGTLISKRFAAAGGADLPEIPRSAPRNRPDLTPDKTP